MSERERIETATVVEVAIWEHLNYVGPVGVNTAFYACEAWLETHGYRQRRAEPVAVECDDTPDDFELESPAPGLTDRQRDLLGALAAPRTIPELVQTLGWSRSAVGGVAGSLVLRGLVVRVEGGLWSRR